MKKAEIEKYVTDLVNPIIDENGFMLWDVCYEKEAGDYYLRVYIDKEGGVDIDDCVLVSRALETKLDAEDKLQDAYILEVSSPGLTRPLKRENDFKNSIGKLVDIKLYKAADGMKEFQGYLAGYSNDSVEIHPLDEKGEELEDTRTILKSEISSIKLAFVE